MSDTLLLATFVQSRNVGETIEIIKENFSVVGNKLFLLQDKSNKHKKIITYNIMKNETVVFSDVIRNTISLHRKKETNTLYTLNALNEIVRGQNDGNVDKEFSVEWEDYKNTLLITYQNEISGDNEIKRINTNLINIVNV
tara:strand:- start:1310 stop:1729 length:420 start_codon:yes stop_codon:yes gene_type:complete